MAEQSPLDHHSPFMLPRLLRYLPLVDRSNVFVDFRACSGGACFTGTGVPGRGACIAGAGRGGVFIAEPGLSFPGMWIARAFISGVGAAAAGA